jgi:Putative DNA-binding domain
MLSLKAAQAKLIATINTGPDVLDPSLFDGPVDRILLGLKAHANTISHARLTALEASFPMTRNALGEAAFNTLSRQYVESSLIGSLDNNHIGCRFSAFLNSADVSVCEYELAQIEWAYLNSYNAPEAQPLCLADLAPLRSRVACAGYYDASFRTNHRPFDSNIGFIGRVSRFIASRAAARASRFRSPIARIGCATMAVTKCCLQ